MISFTQDPGNRGIRERPVMQRVDRVMEGILLGVLTLVPLYMIVKIGRCLLF